MTRPMISDDIYYKNISDELKVNTKFSTVVVTSLIIPLIPFVISMAPLRISGAASDTRSTASDF